MIQTLKNFTTENLFDAALHFLAKLNLKSDHDTVQPLEVADYYDGPMPQYLKDALQNIKDTYFIGVVNDLSLAGGKSQDTFEQITENISHEGKYDGMFVFACDAKAEANLTRSAAAALTRGFNRIAKFNPVILIIRQGEHISLSTCERMNFVQEWRQGQGEKLGKVTILRNINCEKPHRGHVDILETLGDKVYTSFEELYNHWMEVFSSELLTKKFYNELSDWYAWAVMVAKFPNNIKTDEDDAKFNHESCIRLITRLIFVWFLKQKHLIPEEFFDEKYIYDNFIDNFNPHDKENIFYNAEQSKYYRLILQNLFFATLNCPIVEEGKTEPNNRRFCAEHSGFVSKDYNINNIMRYKSEFKEKGADKFLKMANDCVPFLNGGLFDCLDDKPKGLYYDGFSELKESLKQLFIPDYLFFGEEVGNGIDLSKWYDDKKKKNVSARGIIDILKRYSFTIEENTPYDQEVSLDPELLGKVFENLLAAYNPETKQSARKQTGSFYTPREIVQYMVDESLVAHLKRMCGDEMESQYRQLLNYATEDVELTEDQSKSIMNALYNCQVLDPACGSGAFPMGVLQQMVHVLKRIDPTNEMWKMLMIDLAIEKSKIAFGVDSEDERKARLEDIENAFNQSINDPDYARKLYLIEHCIYGVDIQPIATQISKLRFFISLVVDQKPTKDAKTNFGIRPLPNLEAKFVTANTLTPVNYESDIVGGNEKVRKYKEELKDLNHKIFRAKRNSDKERLKTSIKETREKLAEAIMETGFVSEGVSHQLASWDMFDQNASASFFDTEWMFDVKQGFDVVIGNPPYCQISKGLYPATSYPYSEGKDKGKQNLYKLFTEFGYNAAKEDGISCMIVQSSLMCDMSAAHTRELLLRHTCIEQMIEFPKVAPTKEGQVFETVCQGTCIFIIKKHEPQNQKFILSINNDCTTIYKKEEEYISQEALIEFYPEDFAIPLIHKNEFAILKKIKNNLSLREYIVDINQGDFNVSTFKNMYSEKKTSIKLIRGCHVMNYRINYDVSEYVKEGFKTSALTRNQMHTYIASQAITGMVDYRRIHCSLTNKDECFLCGHSVNKTLLKDESVSHYFVCLLNSKLLDWVFRKTSTNNNVNGYELRQLPVKIDKDTAKYKEYVDKLSSYEGKDVYDNDVALEVDCRVYHLYNLTYDEVLIIDPETPITREEYENFKLD